MESFLEDDVVEYKGGTLQIHPEEQKTILLQQRQSQPLTSPIEEDQTESATQSLITPITALPKKLSDRIWKKPDDTNTTKTVLQVFTSPPDSPSDFFTFRDGVIDKAVQECISEVLDPENDGAFISAFLLTEVTLWDTEKERLVLISSNTCSIIKYDFIALRRLECRKILLKDIDSVVIGELVYPPSSLVPRLNGFVNGVSNVVKGCLLESWARADKRFDLSLFQTRERNLSGIRLMWNKGEPLTFTTKWNPFVKDLPFATFISHPLSCLVKENTEDSMQSSIFNIKEFNEKITTAITKIQREENMKNCLIQHNNIVLQSYLGIGSLIHNRNALGFFKVRGKFSF